MSKRSRRKKYTKRRNEGWPLVVYVCIAMFLFVGYIGAELIIAQEPHSFHWLTAGVGSIGGFLVGQVWYHWRGDIV